MKQTWKAKSFTMSVHVDIRLKRANKVYREGVQ